MYGILCSRWHLQKMIRYNIIYMLTMYYMYIHAHCACDSDTGGCFYENYYMKIMIVVLSLLLI